MLRTLRFNKLHRITSIGTFRILFTSSCSRRVAATKPSIDVDVRGHQGWGAGVFAHPPRSLVEPHLNLSQGIVLSLYYPQAAPFQESSILHILDTQRVCSSQSNNWQRQSLQPTAGVSYNIFNTRYILCTLPSTPTTFLCRYQTPVNRATAPDVFTWRDTWLYTSKQCLNTYSKSYQILPYQ